MPVFPKLVSNLAVLSVLAASSLGLIGCASPLTSGNDRVDRCVGIQQKKYGIKHTEPEFRAACVKWEGQHQLGDDGSWSGKQTATG